MNNEQIVKDVIYKVFNEFQLDLIDELYAEDCTVHDPANPAPLVGTMAVKQVMEMYKTAFPDFKYELNDLHSTDNKVTTQWHITGTNTGPMGPIEATGNAISLDGMSVCEIENGKIKTVWQHWDNLGMMKQLGINIEEAVGSSV